MIFIEENKLAETVITCGYGLKYASSLPENDIAHLYIDLQEAKEYKSQCLAYIEDIQLFNKNHKLSFHQKALLFTLRQELQDIGEQHDDEAGDIF